MIVNTINTEGAFRHDLPRFIELSSAVGAGPGTVFAADALVIVDQHDSILFAFITGARWADRHTRGVLAVQAGFRKVNGLGIGEGARLIGLNTIKKCSSGISPVWILIGKRTGCPGGIPLFAGSNTGVASNAYV